MKHLKNYYVVLGVPRQASLEEIKAAFKNLARKHHPDVATGEDSKIKFEEINEAYETLSTPTKRKIYDEQQSQALVTDLNADVKNVVDEYFNQFK